MNDPRHVFRSASKFVGALCFFGLLAGLNAAPAEKEPRQSSSRDGKVHQGAIHLVSGSPQITLPFFDDRRATIAVDIAIENGSKQASIVFIEIVLKDAEGNEVARAETGVEIAAGEQGSTAQWMNWKRPIFWTAENPYRYTLHTTIMQDTDVVDSAESSFGVGADAPAGQ